MLPGSVLPMLLIIGSFLAYHLVTKWLRPDVNTLLFLIMVYAVSLLASFLLWRTVPQPGSAHDAGLRGPDWALAVALGLSLVGIEFGFVWAYRSGWPIGSTAMIGNVITTLMLVPIGWLLFREHVSALNIAGFCLCVVGLVMLSKR